MTPKFDDLIYQSGLIADGCWDELGTYEQEAIERLIELTVLECVKACINEGRTFEVASAGEYSSNLYASAIKKHFGLVQEDTESSELHTCPYAEELYGNYDKMCDCDEERTRQCAMDV